MTDEVETLALPRTQRDAPAHAIEARPPPTAALAVLHHHNRVSLQVTEEIASYQWDLTRIRTLLRTLSSAMTDEVEALAALAPVA